MKNFNGLYLHKFIPLVLILNDRFWLTVLYFLGIGFHKQYIRLWGAKH